MGGKRASCGVLSGVSKKKAGLYVCTYVVVGYSSII